MATVKSGNLIKLYLRENGTTQGFAFVVCNEDLGLEGSSDEISRATKCGTLKAAGTVSYEIPFSGVKDFASTAGQLSETQLATWFQAGTTLDFVYGDNSTGATLINRSGVGIITSHNLNSSVDDLVSFEGTLSVDGNLTITL